MTDPVVCADGLTYQREHIEEWLRCNDTSPLTNVRLANKRLIPNHTLKALITDHLQLLALRARAQRVSCYATCCLRSS